MQELLNKLGKRNLIIISVVAVTVLILIISLIWYFVSISPVSKKKQDEIEVTIPLGSGTSKIADVLKDNKIIKSKLAFKIYVKLNNVSNFQAGTYYLKQNMNLKEITEMLKTGIMHDPNQLNITYIEGKNIRWLAKTIADVTNNTEEDVFSLLEDEEYIDSLIQKYWFITDEIKNSKIYYPLEGYLLPDTYVFENKDISVKNIFSVILNFTDKYLTSYRDEIEENGLPVHQILTLASIAELEGKSTEDRAEIIGVFYNRILDGMSLGSDVTTYYAFKVDMGDRDLTAKELNTENPYNTRGPHMEGKIPIGPICNPSKSAIEATLNYKQTDAYYFVADKNGKVYFTKNNSEHNRKIQELKKDGLWFTY